jgi:hypothetical protein
VCGRRSDGAFRRQTRVCRCEVEEMLALASTAQSFLERPAIEIALVRDGMTTAGLRQAFESALASKTVRFRRRVPPQSGYPSGPL